MATAFQGFKPATDREVAKVDEYVIYPAGLGSAHAEAMAHGHKEFVEATITSGPSRDSHGRNITNHRLVKITGKVLQCGPLELLSSIVFSKQPFNAYVKFRSGQYWNFIENPASAIVADPEAPTGTVQLGRKWTYRINNNACVLEFEDQGRLKPSEEAKVYTLSTALHAGETGGVTLGNITNMAYDRSKYKEGNVKQVQIQNSAGTALLGLMNNSAFEFLLEAIVGEDDMTNLEQYRPSKAKMALILRGLQVSRLNLLAYNTCLKEDTIITITLINGIVITINQASLIGDPVYGDRTAVVNINSEAEYCYNNSEGSQTTIVLTSSAITLTNPTS